jgi:hypothetical protein
MKSLEEEFGAMRRRGLWSLMLVALLVFSFVASACQTGEDSETFKVGVVTGTVSQSEDEYQAAQIMKEKYPDRVEHVTYPDNFMQEQETMISRIVSLASDPDIKAIVICQAVPGTIAAIDKVKETRPDMLFLIGVTHEDPSTVASKADVVLERDEPQRGRTIIEMAANLGATKFLHYSFPRHMSQELLAQRMQIMKETCAELGLEFLEVAAPDPMGPDGLPGTQRFILEDVPLQVEMHGKDIAVFGTNLGMMEAMIRAALEAGCIFPEQCSPGPTVGFPGALAIDVKGMAGNTQAIMDAIEEKIVELGGAGRFATWPVALNKTFIQALVEMAFEAVEGNIDLQDANVVSAALEKEAGTSVELRQTGEKNNHYFVIVSSHVFGADAQK